MCHVSTVMSIDNSELNEQFKLVTYKRRRKNTKIVASLVSKLTLDEDGDESASIRHINKAKDDLLTSDVYLYSKASIEKFLGTLSHPKITRIVCFGLGKIGECETSRTQLAFLLCLKDLFCADALVYDPIFSKTDRAVLKTFECEVLEHNVEGKYTVETDGTTVFYLPHCPKQLCNNLLWSNWGLKLNRCIIIANSFTDIVERTPKRLLSKSVVICITTHSVTQPFTLSPYPTFNQFPKTFGCARKNRNTLTTTSNFKQTITKNLPTHNTQFFFRYVK